MKELSKKCKENEPAYCTVECPFNLDICTMMNKLLRGSFKAAYRLYQSAVAFPMIVSELCGEQCKSLCPRKEKDAAVELRKIEQAIACNAGKISPQKYNVPKKNKRIAVVGAGISGLSCALKLCIKKYEVVVFEKSTVCGGHLWDIMPDDVFMEDICRQFEFDKPEIIYNREISGIRDPALSGFDAIYIAPGKEDNCFCTSDILDASRLTTDMDGVFAGGSIKGVDTVNAIAQGIRASVEIEKYLLTGIMPETPKRLSTELCERDIDEIEFIFPCEEKVYSKEQAAEEAKRCLQCSCDACAKKCDLISFYNKSPLKIMDEVRGTTELKSVVSDITVATRMIASCNQCGSCSEACPEHISFQELFLQARQILLKKGKLPWAFNDFFIRDMMNAHEMKSFFSPQTHNDKIRYLFFPGCQLGASDPLYVLKSYEKILKYETATAILVDCCGAPAFWAGIDIADNVPFSGFMQTWEEIGRPEVIFACATCMKIITRYNENVRGIMLYDLLEKWDLKPERKYNNEHFAVFDPCSTAQNRQVRDSIRKLAEKAELIVEEMNTKDNIAGCCGYGGNTSIVNPEYTEQIIQKRISKSDLTYITYCSNCRDTFAYRGKPAVHILDIIFDLNESDRKAPYFSDRRRNRKRLKEEIGMTYDENYKKEVNCHDNKLKPIVFSEEMKQKINSEYILEEEVEKVVRYCEDNRKKMVSAEGNYIGHLKIGYMTYWVEYDDLDDYYYIMKAYSHRMYVKGGNEF